VADHAKIDLEVVSLPHLGGSALTEADLEISTGPYEAHEIPSTNVPNRNMIFLAFAIAKALREGAGAVAYAAHAGDHEGYPDCRPAFAAPLAKATSSLGVLLDAPFLDLTKQQVVCLGLAYGAPLHLTYSCYRGGAKHCGDCGTCIERRLAFRLEDPTEYA
jgi:7-cyano-7-deazaguanine synthase